MARVRSLRLQDWLSGEDAPDTADPGLAQPVLPPSYRDLRKVTPGSV
jgi:hypothetical protein